MHLIHTKEGPEAGLITRFTVGQLLLLWRFRQLLVLQMPPGALFRARLESQDIPACEWASS